MALTKEQQRALALARARHAAAQKPEADMSLKGRIKDNLVGVDDGVMSVGEKAAALLNKAGESLTLGVVGDEAAGAADALIGRGGYEDRRDFYRDQEAAIEEAHPGLSFAAEVAPAFVPGVGLAKGAAGAATLGGKIGRASLGGGAAGAIYGAMEGETDQERLIGALQSGGVGAGLSAAVPVVGAAISRPAKKKAEQAFIEAQPTGEELKDQAGRLYEIGRQMGLIAPAEAIQEMDGEFRRILTKQGAISPKGRVVGDFPKAKAVLDLLDDYAEGSMTPEQIQSTRRMVQDVARSTDATERRLGVKMLKVFDGIADRFVPELKPANELYRRAMKNEKIQEAVELAGVRAGQFTGSGFENALRTEFRQLDRRIVKGQEKGFSKDEVALIRRIARGGTAENVARNVGRVAPSSILNAGVTGSAAFMLGNALAGPGLGVALAGGSLLAGHVGRKAATKMQNKNALMLNALTRSESAALPTLPAPNSLNALEGGLYGLIASQGD